MSAAAAKPIYAPLPARAIGDKKLTAEELWVLGALAVHDRLGANGIGCYASHLRLSDLVGCHEKSLSRSLKALAVAGYINASQHPLNNRLRVYKVIYSEFDAAYLKAGIGNKVATNDSSKGNKPATVDEPIGNNPVPETGPIGNKPNPESQQNQDDDSVNILGETSNTSSRSDLNISRESAPLSRRDEKGGKERGEVKTVDAQLAMLERAIKEAGAASNQQRLLDTYLWLQEIVDDHGGYSTGGTGGWANRLGEEVLELMDDDTFVRAVA